MTYMKHTFVFKNGMTVEELQYFIIHHEIPSDAELRYNDTDDELNLEWQD
jgi:hypothetical protein